MIFDGHTDTLARLDQASSFFEGTNGTARPTQLDLPRAFSSRVSGIVLAACAEAEPDHAAAWDRMKGIWDGIAAGIPDVDDAPELFLMAEGCEPLLGLPDLEDVIGELGVASLTWNGENSLGGGIGSSVGLTARGRQLAARLHEAGVVLDVSHLCDRSRRDLLLTGLPTVATHCNCREVWDHPRNLPTDDIREIASGGGVIGITFPPAFLGKQAGLEHVAMHLEYALEIAGPDGVGFGSDFDGSPSL
ncbi:membrane dipeptidase, partial [Candidatus Fermentibacterales bacterium]|nr:membrane dipeptidase [Candidatus Fermentibacterales bacterium]